MSLAIDVNKIFSVLLDDGWHGCIPGTFTIDAYEYGYYDSAPGASDAMRVLHAAGRHGLCAPGFAFKTETDGRVHLMSGPLDSIKSVARIDDED